MKPLALTLAVALGCVALEPAVAQPRPFTPALTCSAIKALVSQERNVTLASSEHAYEMVHAESMECASDETGFPAFMPSQDEPSCMAGWRCRQRANEGNSK